ncbi:hypothetical protein LTR04_006498 [Oleoguttula sp. CCFEE 6159]|nr:hypothetical protein LTR04_006498 [Oleoguttula sp. CCFEE 6159]
MSQWGGAPRSPTIDVPPSPTTAQRLKQDEFSTSPSTNNLPPYAGGSPTPRNRADSAPRPSSRPASMLQTYQPPLMEVAQDTLPELQPIFTFLNSHQNKLYQEGYFLKLHDLDSTRQIESLPMDSQGGGNLQNVLSISTAGNNRYLLHFNSLNSLTQWTAGIRLAMFEHATLQEAYTGSLIAGKGRMLNNIGVIMERTKFKSEDWARVRFGAGTPWRRCWCVITPPDEKEYQKLQKTLKKRPIYDRSTPVPKGDIKFYETRKVTKKTRPIATISDAYSAYAIYPQSKPLIDQSTLVKLEGSITIHSSPPSTTEGFIFVMPEVHPAVTGFEIMLRWLLPVFDTFALYGRPNRLIADSLDQRGLMFAMPKEKRYGYLEILDVSSLIHTNGSQNWSERQWRKELKKLTASRMTTEDSPRVSGIGPRRNTISRTSLPPTDNNALRFDDGALIHSSPTSRRGSPAPPPGESIYGTPRRVDSAPPIGGRFGSPHKRSASDAVGHKRHQADNPSRLPYEQHTQDEYNEPPPPPIHASLYHGGVRAPDVHDQAIEQASYATAESEIAANHQLIPGFEELRIRSSSPPPTPVAAPPAFIHGPSEKPRTKPNQAPELRRATSAIDAATLSELAQATHASVLGSAAPGGTAATRRPEVEGDENGGQQVAYERQAAGGAQRGVFTDASDRAIPADDSIYHQGMVNSRREQTEISHRLPTIPASPYVHQSEYFSPSLSNGTIGPAAPVFEEPSSVSNNKPEHTIAASSGPPQEDGPQDSITPTSIQIEHSVPRKPLPGQPSHADQEPTSPSSLGSLRNDAVDQDALFRMLNEEPLERVLSNGSSAYDNESLASTDYASTTSEPPKRPVERPRAGVLKTVGNPDLVPKNEFAGAYLMDAESSANIPSIDFGPTMAYTPNAQSRPGTSGTITQAMLQRDASSPAKAGQKGSAGERSASPGSDPNVPAQDTRRTVAWQPGVSAAGAAQNGRQTLTPEQWVQHRAAVAAQPQIPVYAHGRNKSSGNLVSAVRSSSGGAPPISRNSSGDWSQMATPHPRSPSRELPHRPQSRGAGVMLDPPSPGRGLIDKDYSKVLSAREQMHVARATGSPLINAVGKNKRPEESQKPTLLSAISAREREKQSAKEGARSAVVQQAIAQRQQQQAQAQMMAQAQAGAQAQAQQLGSMYQQQEYPSPQMMHPQQAPQLQYFGQNYGVSQMQPQYYQQPQMLPQHGYMSPHAQAFAQGGGWSTPGTPGGAQYGLQQQQQQQQQAQRGQGQGQYGQPGIGPQGQRRF